LCRSISKPKNSAALEETPREKKLKARVLIMRTKIKRLRQALKRCQEKVTRKRKLVAKESSEYKILRELSLKLLPANIAGLVSVQVDALTKKPRGRRYCSEFKQWALHFYFCKPASYKELRKQFALPSERVLRSFMNTCRQNKYR